MLGPWIEHLIPPALETSPGLSSHQLLSTLFPALSMFPSLEAVCKPAALCGGMDVIDYKWGFVSAVFEQGCDTQGLCAVCLLALILHSTTRWLCSYSKGFLEPTMSGSEAASGRQALASAVWGACGANDDAIHPGLEIVLFSFP